MTILWWRREATERQRQGDCALSTVLIAACHVVTRGNRRARLLLALEYSQLLQGALLGGPQCGEILLHRLLGLATRPGSGCKGYVDRPIRLPPCPLKDHAGSNLSCELEHVGV